MEKLVLPYLYGRQKNKVNSSKTKVLIISYYWPPSGGSGVQRWMYFAKYLKEFNHEPIVITVDENQASYPVLDPSLINEVKGIRVIKTNTREPLKLYSRLISGKSNIGIPQGEVNTKSFFGKIAAYIRGNFYIPDARKGWIPFVVEAANKILQEEKISFLITTGPPHSSHLSGIRLKEKFDLNWWVDFRDPWGEVFYNKQMFRSKKSNNKDAQFEKIVLEKASGVITTIGGDFHKNLLRKNPQKKVISIPNGFDEELILKTKSAPKKKGFHIVYTGLLTQNQSYLKPLEIINDFSKKYEINFSIAGNIKPTIISEIKKTLCNVNVDFLGYISHEYSVALIKSADLLLNFIFKGGESDMISGKLLEYMATEVPIISIGDPNSEAARFLNSGSHAWMINENSISIMKKHLKSLLEQKIKLINKTPNIENWGRRMLTQRLIKEVLT